MILHALSTGQLSDTQRDVYEGTSGSTGISLACICISLGLRLHIVMPDDQADEKKRLLEALHAEVTVVPSCAISNSNHYVNQARRLAKKNGGYFMDQFENINNRRAHFETTGPEIFRQVSEMGLQVDGFVMVR
jgi:cysteine synthase